MPIFSIGLWIWPKVLKTWSLIFKSWTLIFLWKSRILFFRNFKFLCVFLSSFSKLFLKSPFEKEASEIELNFVPSIAFDILINSLSPFFWILEIIFFFAISNYLLMPLINKYRDDKQNKKFKYSHFISVAINFVQMIFLVLLLV